MTDPLSITAGIIAVAGLAYSSSQALYELISTIQNAPQMFQELNQYIAALSQTLEALKTNLDGRGMRLSESQIACLQETKPTLEGCDLACKDFKAKMEGLTMHSNDGRRSFRDSVKLHFQNKKHRRLSDEASWLERESCSRIRRCTTVLYPISGKTTS